MIAWIFQAGNRQNRCPDQKTGKKGPMPHRLSKKPLYVKQDAMKGCKPFIFHRIDRLCRSGGAIFRSKAQKNHFRSLAMQDEPFHPAWSVSKTSFFDTLRGQCPIPLSAFPFFCLPFFGCACIIIAGYIYSQRIVQ